jgi:hypothetical protein
MDEPEIPPSLHIAVASNLIRDFDPAEGSPAASVVLGELQRLRELCQAHGIDPSPDL